MKCVENYCFDCSQMLCNECTKQHKQTKAIRHHEILGLTEAAENIPKLMESLGQNHCKVHNDHVLDLYCTDCHVELCVKCYINNHQQHRLTELNKCAEGFRNELEDLVCKIESCEHDIKNRKLQLNSEKLDLVKEAKNILGEIEAARQETQETVDKHTDLLISDINSQKTAKSNAIDEFYGKVDTKLNILSNFKTFCKELIQNGSSSDVCTFINDIKTKSEELYHMSELTVKQSQTSFRMDLRLGRNEHHGDFNFVGRLQDKNSVDCDDESNEDGIKRLTEEINQLTQELQKERTLRMSKEKQLEAYIQHAEATLMEDHKKETTELIGKINAMQTELDFLRTLASGDVSPKPKEGSIDYTCDVSYHSVVRPVETTGRQISGLAILGNELNIAGRFSSIVEVWNLETMQFRRRWRLQDMEDPVDMVSCSVTNCLYLVAKMKAGKYVIARVNLGGALLKSWSIGDTFGNLSSTEEGNVLLTVAKDSAIQEYSRDGILLRTIELPWHFGFNNLHHAVKLSTNHFIVSHGSYNDCLHRVCIVDGAGEVLKSYGREWNRFDLNCPVYMIRDSGGNILVADEQNGCIHAFKSNLQPIITAMAKNSSDRGLKETDYVMYTFKPRKICLDESRSRLFVVETVSEKRDGYKPKTSEMLSVFTLQS